MAWFKVDDNFYDHPKVDELSLEAVGLWLLCGTYCARQLTNGYLPHRRVTKLGGSESAIDELLDAGLWDDAEGGYQFHDWDEYQPTRDKVESKRESDRERKRKQRRNESGQFTDSMQESTDCHSVTPDGITLESEPESHRPDPTRPDPSPEEESSSEVADATTRPDVLSLLDLLDGEIKANGLKVPSRNKKNTDAIRLLIDRDGYTSEQIAWIIRWAANNEFWRTNILSASKLREKFTQLMAKAGVSKPTTGKGFNGEIDVDAILGRDRWMLPTPPEDLPEGAYTEWARNERAKHDAERLEEARRKVEA